MKRKPFFLSNKEQMRISEALGMLVADLEKNSRNLRWDRKLMEKWDTLLTGKRIQVL